MKKNISILIFIFLLVVGVRVWLVWDIPSFSDDYSYFVIRQVEHIHNTGYSLYDDPLSYGGRLFVGNPGFFYIMAFFSLFFPKIIVFKIIPQLLIGSVIFIMYLLGIELTKNETAALVTATLSAFIPIVLGSTLNVLTPMLVVLPVMLLALYCFLRLEQNRDFIYVYIACVIILCASHASVILLPISLGVYMVLVKTEKLGLTSNEFEIILFSIFLTLWSQFLIYKKALLYHGPLIIWQNIPHILLTQYFIDFSILRAISAMGLLPFLFGLYVIYDYTFRKKSKQMYLLISFALLMLLLVWLKMIKLDEGLVFLSMILLLLFGVFCKMFYMFLQKTKFAGVSKYVWVTWMILFIITAGLPSVQIVKQVLAQAPSQEELDALYWMRDNSENTSTILASLSEGHLITGIAERKNVMDNNFILIDDINERFNDLNQTFRAIFKTQALDLLGKYGVNYIYFSNQTKGLFRIDELNFVDSNCFQLVYNTSVKIYQARCELVVQK